MEIGRIKISWFVIAISTFGFLSFPFIYILGLSNDQIYYFFPYVSDAGGTPPSANIFTLELVIIAFVLSLLNHIFYDIYLRRAIEQNISERQEYIIKFMNFTKWNAYLAYMFAILVSVSRITEYFYTHYVLASTMFILLGTYVCLNTRLMFYLHPEIFGKKLVYFAFLLTMVYGFFGFICAVTLVRSLYVFDGPNFLKWTPNYAGYTEHVISAICEWIVIYTYNIYLTSISYSAATKMYLVGFRKVELEEEKISETFLLLRE